MLEDLDNIDWSVISQVRGPATDLPQLLRELASGDEERSGLALGELQEAAVHQGTVYPASPLIASFLLELLAAREVAEREQVVWLVASIADGRGFWSVEDDWSAFGASLKVRGIALDMGRNFNARIEQACRDAVLQRVDALLPLLEDPDRWVRGGAAYATFHFTADARVAASVRGRIGREQEPELAAALGLALASGGHQAPEAFGKSREPLGELARRAAGGSSLRNELGRLIETLLLHGEAEAIAEAREALDEADRRS